MVEVRWQTVLVAAVLGVAALGVGIGLWSPADSQPGTPEVDRQLTNGASFSTIPEQTSAHTVRVVWRTEGPESNRTATLSYSRYANGTVIEYNGRPLVSSEELAESEPEQRYTSEETLITDGEEYTMRVYPGGPPSSLLEHRLVDGNRTYERGIPTDQRLWDGLVFRWMTYERNGTATFQNRTLRRYDIVGVVDAYTTDQPPGQGYILVTEDGVVRYGTLTAQDADRTEQLKYSTRDEPGRPIPEWESKLQALPPEEPSDDPERPTVVAYRSSAGIALVANETWTPPAGSRLAVLSYNQEVLGTVNTTGQLLRDGTRDTPKVFVGMNGSTLDIEWNATGDLDIPTNADRVLIDHSGANYYDVELHDSSSLASTRSQPARLRPANGGGRILRLDHFEIGSHVESSTPVTLSVGNDSVSRSVTMPASEFPTDRVFVVRTTDGLELVDYEGIAPLEFPTEASIAPRRFVENASLRVTVGGVPAIESKLPTRVTQSSDRPLSKLRTGLSVDSYDSPSGLKSQFLADKVEATDWDGYTLIKVHNWNYETLRVGGGLSFDRNRCRKDRNCLYRISDGTEFRVKTENGTSLVEQPVQGTETVVP